MGKVVDILRSVFGGGDISVNASVRQDKDLTKERVKSSRRESRNNKIGIKGGGSFTDSSSAITVNIGSLKIENLHIEESLPSGKASEIRGNDVFLNAAVIGDEKIKEVMSAGIAGLEHNDYMLEKAGLDEFNDVVEETSGKSFKVQFEKYRKLVPKMDEPILNVVILAKKYSDVREFERVRELRNQLFRRYSMRGIMLCNLFTAGYFDTELMPLFQDYKTGLIDHAQYMDAYENLISNPACAIFVPANSDYERLKSELINKIQNAKESGDQIIKLHGVGRSSEKTIRGLIVEPDVVVELATEPSIEEKDPIFNAILFI